MQKTQKTFSCRRKIHPTPGTLSNQLSVTWETRRENWNLPGPVNYATQNGRPCPRTGIFFCKATSAQDRNLQPPKALNKDRTPPKHALARAVEYTALGTGVRAEARPIAHFFLNRIRIVSPKRLYLQNLLVFEHAGVAQLYMQLVWIWYSN